MKSNIRTTVKWTVIGIIIAVLVWATVHIGILAIFSYISKWAYNVEDFADYQADFEAAASFCIEYSLDHPTENGLCYFDYGYGELSGEILYDAEIITVPEDIKYSFLKIQEAFPHKDAYLDTIEYYNGTVYFETDNLLYSLVYSPEGKPKLISRLHEGTAKRITGDWYHVVRK